MVELILINLYTAGLLVNVLKFYFHPGKHIVYLFITFCINNLNLKVTYQVNVVAFPLQAAFSLLSQM